MSWIDDAASGSSHNDVNAPKFLPLIDKSTANKNDQETPIFSKVKLLSPNVTGTIESVCVCKNWMVCLTTPVRTIKRYFLQRAVPPGEINLEKYLAGYKISKLFFDPTGYHLLIALVPESQGLSADFLYIHDNGPKVRRIEKFKDQKITAVAFNVYNGNESTTGPILLGTSRGLILETELTPTVERAASGRQLYTINRRITGLEMFRMPNCNKYVVVAVTPDCVYTFQETLRLDERSLQPIFATYLNGMRSCSTINATSDLNYSVIRFYTDHGNKYPKQWAWLHGSGIHIGEVSTDVTKDNILEGNDVISFALDDLKHLAIDERRQNVPKTFLLTEFHALLLYHDHFTAICLLDQSIVHEEYFRESDGTPLNLIRDHFTGDIYLYTDRVIYKVRVTAENRNIWQVYLQKGCYDQAEFYAIEQPDKFDYVLQQKAEAALTNGDHLKAAEIYSETEKPFEEICLKFMALTDKEPIIRYVRERLSKVRENDREVIMLISWLIDLYLIEINMPGRAAVERTKWQGKFDEFMRDPLVTTATCTHRQIVQNLIAQHADAHNLSQFATANGDYEEVMRQQLSAKQYSIALQTLRAQKNIDLYYKYCPILVEQLPVQTMDAIIRQDHRLEFDKLVPTLMSCDQSPLHIEQLVRYLEFAIFKMGEENEAAHNLLLRLYAEHQPKQLLTYLHNEGQDTTFVHYDLLYALRVCTKHNHKTACVFIQCLLQMWSVAVDFALTFDMELAKRTASQPSNIETRRKLWLRIAYHDIKGTNDVQKALQLLKECDLLSIEDLLPFFSDFEKIDDFKEPICRALQQYNNEIQELQHEMKECSKQSEAVQDSLQNLRTHRVRIEAHATCSLCDQFLLLRPFFLFNCGHKFHNDCLEKNVIPLLSSDESRRLTSLKQQLESLVAQPFITSDNSRKQQKQRDAIKLAIEKILAADCYYCGLMIETIDKPLFDVDWEQDIDWE